MKKRNLTIVLAILLLLTAVLSAGCGGREKSISSISVAAGSFKEVYVLDEKPDFSKAQLVVSYTNGTKTNVPITPDMVSGLSTAKTVSGAVLTVTYKNYKATFMYKVEGTVNVDTAVRLKLFATPVEERAFEIKVRIYGIEEDARSVYAVKFNITGVDGALPGEVSSLLPEGFIVKSTQIADNSLSVVIYSVTGYESLTEGSELVSISATKTLALGSISIQSITMSDGVKDYVVPGMTIKIA